MPMFIKFLKTQIRNFTKSSVIPVTWLVLIIFTINHLLLLHAAKIAGPEVTRNEFKDEVAFLTKLNTGKKSEFIVNLFETYPEHKIMILEYRAI